MPHGSRLWPRPRPAARRAPAIDFGALLPAVAVLFPLVGAWASPTRAAATDVFRRSAAGAAPAPFRDTDGGFEVRFVGEPARDEKVQTVNGVTVRTHRYTEEVRGLGLVVSWSDHPESWRTTPDQRLRAARDAALEGAAAESDVALALPVSGAVGREFTFEKAGVRVSQRVIVRGNRLYQVLAVRAVGAKRETATRTFLDSFKVLAAPIPAGRPPGERSEETARPRAARPGAPSPPPVSPRPPATR